MKYQSSQDFTHLQHDKIGVLITNLGTPAAPTKAALKPYLKEFLSDPRVVEVPRLIWWLVLNGIILNIRPKRSAHAYSTVWTERGSPLLYHTQDQKNAIEAKLKATMGDNIVVEFAMRYGQPSVASVLDKMFAQGVRKLVVLPLYPQYCASTVGSTFDAIANYLKQTRWVPELRFINQYCDFAPYIQAQAKKIKAHWNTYGRADKLIFSYHGIPKRYLTSGDPYFCQCHKTSRLLADALGLSSDDYLTTFQSRFGREEWLKPYTDETLKSLPSTGVKSVQVVCPGFSSDCLETIEEIGVENRGYFMESGGERYEYIPCLNADQDHTDCLTQLISEHMQGWDLKPPANELLTQRASLASSLGAEK